jgi:peptide/nickel transport system permease protein
MKYVAGRILHGIVLLFGVSLLSFAFAQLAPGDYFSDMRIDPSVSSATVDALRAKAGLDRPFPVRYAAWAAAAVKGDFGYSLSSGAPVSLLLRERVGPTLLLTGTASLLAWLLAIPIGIWNATRRSGWQDSLARLVLVILLVVPDLLIAIVLLVVAAQTGWFPTGGMESPGAAGLPFLERLRDVAFHMTLPVTVLVIGMLPVLVRHVRAAMIEVLDSAFALNARAQGIPRRRLLFRHLLPAAVNPLVSLFGITIGTLLSASLLIEVMMGWPGLGPLLVDAIMARDTAVVLGVILLSAAFLVTGNLVADLLLYRLDPRIRVKG